MSNVIRNENEKILTETKKTEDKKEKRAKSKKDKTLGIKNLKISKKAIAILAASTLVIGGTFATWKIWFDEIDVEMATTELVEKMSENTVLDEVLEQSELVSVADLDTLEKVVKLSEELHELNLSSQVKDLTRFEMPESYNVEDVNILIERYNELSESDAVKKDQMGPEDREFTQLALQLEAIERAVNNSLSNDAYETLANAGILFTKAKVLDASGYDETELSHIRIQGDYTITYNDPVTSKTYTLVPESNLFHSSVDMREIIGNIYEWQTESKTKTTTGTSYNGERNEDILDAINLLKLYSATEFSLDGSKIERETSVPELRQKMKTLTTENSK